MPIDASIPLKSVAPHINSPQETLAQVYDLRNAAQTEQLNQYKLAEAERTQATAIRTEAEKKILDTAKGKLRPGFDRAAIIASVPENLRFQLQQDIDEVDGQAAKLKKARIEAEAAQADYFGSLGSKMEASKYDPGAAALAIAHVRETYGDDPQMTNILNAYEQRIKADPTQIQVISDELIQGSPTYRELRGKEAQEKLRTEQEARALRAAQQLAKDRIADNKRQADAAAETERHHRATEAATASAAGRGLTPNAESLVINRLTKNWDDANKGVRQLDTQVKLMDAGLTAARRGDLAQGAQAILVTFQKILDPPSVVRESEYNRSGAGLALKARVQGILEQYKRGGAGVPLVELEKFARLAREAAAAQRTGVIDEIRGRIGRQAAHYNIPNELIFESEGTPTTTPLLPGGNAAPAAAPPKPQTGLGLSWEDYQKSRGKP